jgi:hypothetical protein
MDAATALGYAAHCRCAHAFMHPAHLDVTNPVSLQEGWQWTAKGDDGNQHTCRQYRLIIRQCFMWSEGPNMLAVNVWSMEGVHW